MNLKRNKAMKTNLLTYIAAALALFAMASCNDIVNYDDGYTPLEDQANTGAPVITAVYAVSDTAMLTPITEADAGQMVRIVGKNLNNVKRITFNTVEADLSGVYTYSTSANVTIPQELSMEHQNKIEYTTDKGTATFDFTVPFPQLRVDGLLCEFTNAGDSVTILGQNFDYYNFGTASQVTIGGTALGLGSITNTSMKAEIPEGTPDNSTITVTWTDGSTGTQMTATLPFRPTKNLLYGDMSDASFSVSGLTMELLTDGDAVAEETSLGNPHMRFTGQVAAWSWNQIDLSRNLIDIDGMNINTLPAEELGNYVLKFEIYNSNDYSLTGGSTFESYFNWTDPRYVWNIGDGAGINTHEEWQTITWPLNELAHNGLYTYDPEKPIEEQSRWTTLSIVFKPDAAYTADFRMGNFRIEHK